MPVPEPRHVRADAEADELFWYEHALSYVARRRRGLAGNSMRSIAETLATVTPVLLVPGKDRPDDRQIREALYCWAFRGWSRLGRRRDPRQLKHRAKGEVRPVPCHPALTRYLRRHIEEYGTASDSRLFRGERGGDLSESVYQRAWQRARSLAFTPPLAASSLAGRPYDLRHACLSTWLNAGVDPTQVAEWAGNCVELLLRVYAKCIQGREELNRKLIGDALRDGEEGEAGDEGR